MLKFDDWSRAGKMTVSVRRRNRQCHLHEGRWHYKLLHPLKNTSSTTRQREIRGGNDEWDLQGAGRSWGRSRGWGDGRTRGAGWSSPRGWARWARRLRQAAGGSRCGRTSPPRPPPPPLAAPGPGTGSGTPGPSAPPPRHHPHLSAPVLRLTPRS